MSTPLERMYKCLELGRSHKAFVEATAKWFGYPSVRAWADGRQYEGREVRGYFRSGSYKQPCNQIAGEMVFLP